MDLIPRYNHITTDVFLWLLLLLAVGCSEINSDQTEAFVPTAKEKAQTTLSQSRANRQFLAYEHRVSIEIPTTKIAATYQRIITACTTDQHYQCTLLHSGINSGDYPSGNIRLRLLPEGANTIIALAAKAGDIASQSVDVEDLGDSIVDNKKRLKMLTAYQQRLEVLEQRTDHDIDSLIKVASALSNVQTDLEYAEGVRAKLLQRVQMDIVNIRLFSHNQASFWSPVADAFDDFADNVSQSIASVIIFIALLIPWAVILVLVIITLRYLWRWLKKP